MHQTQPPPPPPPPPPPGSVPRDTLPHDVAGVPDEDDDSSFMWAIQTMQSEFNRMKRLVFSLNDKIIELAAHHTAEVRRIHASYAEFRTHYACESEELRRENKLMKLKVDALQQALDKERAKSQITKKQLEEWRFKALNPRH